ncbi:uncharacterized protein LOC102803070, partial [Saccoglossus kowalevskii]|uniref:Uncharacterized protein LOC102800955 n=1 Tax=Saccoglossus kowalevskii TaxID=10224 RepID=A0ABM0M6B2_SACKO
TSKNQTRCLWINGTEEQINDARQRIEKLIAQSTESEIQDRVQHGHRLEHETQSRNKYVKEPVAEKKKNICFVKPKQILRKTKMKVETTNDGANVTKSKIVDDSLLKPLVMYASSDEEEDVTIDTK